MTWRAHWFDGRSTRVLEAEVSVQAGEVRVRRPDSSGAPGDSATAHRLDQLVIGERFHDAPRMIALPDGSSLQVEEDDAGGFDQALRQAGHRPSRAYRLMQRWCSVAACAVTLIALIVWLDLQGAGLIASAASRIVPYSVDRRIGRTALALADGQWLAPSRTPATRQARLRARFSVLARRQYPTLQWRIVFRSTRSENGAFNAFALPDGTIVLLDRLVEGLTDDEVIAVLAHELGHIVHRDTLRGLLRRMGLLTVAGVVWGGLPAAATATAAGVQGLHYSRDAERQADAFGVVFLERAGLSPQTLADAFRVAESEQMIGGERPAFLSDHPPTPERVRAVEAAARGSPRD